MTQPQLAGKSILLTGGTGSFGRAFAAELLRPEHQIHRLVVFSRDELKQFELSSQPRYQDRRIRFFLGDVRDRERLYRALEGIDIVVHAAALKQVPAAEYNPFEFIKTNVVGAQNVVEACLDRNVSQVVALSTDKAAAPVNLYGATKLCSDKLFIAANSVKGPRNLRISVVRYGNVMGSRGSVVPFFLSKRAEGVLPITHPEMTRFNITLQDCVRMVLFALGDMRGGEIYVPRIPSYRILDLAEAVAPDCRLETVGIRPGEKLHEEMITTSDTPSTLAFPTHFIICPSNRATNLDSEMKSRGGKLCPDGFSYNSRDNAEKLNVEQIRALIRQHVAPNFAPVTS